MVAPVLSLDMDTVGPAGRGLAHDGADVGCCAGCPHRHTCPHGSGTPDADAVRELVAAWYGLSIGSAWRNAGDWLHPAVEAFAEALTTGGDPLPRAERLGGARAVQGVGIAEALEDVSHAYAALGTIAPDDVVRAAAVGWVEVQEAAAVQPALVDPLSGLFTVEYLRARIRETYLDADAWALLVVDVGLAGLRAPERFERSAAVGDALTAVFGSGHPMANVDDGLFVVLVRRDGTLGGRIDETRARVVPLADAGHQARLMRHPAHVWLESLPDGVADVPALLGSLRS